MVGNMKERKCVESGFEIRWGVNDIEEVNYSETYSYQ